jgi:hypothetical protein
MTCPTCDGRGYLEYERPDRLDVQRIACEDCGAWMDENPREAGDDDGVEYSDPRDPYDEIADAWNR